MDKSKHPTKEQVRAYLLNRQIEQRPPPSQKEIRRRLGWDFITSKLGK